VLSTITMNTTLILFAVIAAFGVMMVAATILPIVQQANAIARPRAGGPPCLSNEHVAANAKPCQR
jgi:hypothetical protein